MAVILQENLISCWFGSCTFIGYYCNSVILNKCILNPEIIVLFYSFYAMIDTLESCWEFKTRYRFFLVLLYYICIVKLDILEFLIVINVPNHHKEFKNRKYSRQNELKVIYYFEMYRKIHLVYIWYLEMINNSKSFSLQCCQGRDKIFVCCIVVNVMICVAYQSFCHLFIGECY